MGESNSRRPAKRKEPEGHRSVFEAGGLDATPEGAPKQAPAERRLISDLLQALPAAFLIGVLPGWFWTRCLLASGDRAEQLAYAVALSLTLVPTVALAQTYLFATGVTFGVTIVSVALVFLAGLAAYLLFGAGQKERGATLPRLRLPASDARAPRRSPRAGPLDVSRYRAHGMVDDPDSGPRARCRDRLLVDTQGRDAPPAGPGRSIPAAGATRCSPWCSCSCSRVATSGPS